MERIAMSQEERDRLDWLKRARDGQVTQKWAAEKMGVSDRWVRRLLAAMKEKGDGVVVHGLRGRASNRRVDEKIRERAMEIVAAGTEPLRELIGAMHSKLLLAALRRHRAAETL